MELQKNMKTDCTARTKRGELESMGLVEDYGGRQGKVEELSESIRVKKDMYRCRK